MFGNFVFDIDGAMAIAVDYSPEEKEEKVKKELGEAYFNKYCLTALNYPHYIFPGYYALFKWLDALGGKLFFFSSGVESRNVELAEKMIKMAFGEKAENVPYKVFSREDCKDTSYMRDEEAALYQSVIFGNRKKKLGGVVVPNEEIENSLLIEDDPSYMTKNEEYNLVYIGYSYYYLGNRGYAEYTDFLQFHKAYYLTGLLATMFELRENRNMTLVEASKYLQYEIEGIDAPSRDVIFPKLLQRIEYYHKGLAILKQIDPSLKFFWEMPPKKER